MRRGRGGGDSSGKHLIWPDGGREVEEEEGEAAQVRMRSHEHLLSVIFTDS